MATARLDLAAAAAREFERAMQRNLKGLEYFQTAGRLGATAKDVLIERGTMRLYHYHPMAGEVYRVPVPLVMATTNRGYIFDMVPGQSLVEYLLRAGFDVFMLDWTAPRADEKSLTLDSYVLDNLWDDEFVKSYRMFDRWSSDTLPLAGEYFRETVKKLIWGNQLLSGELEVGGRSVDLANITATFLHVAAEHDHIVPVAASAPIGMVGSADRQEIVLKGGHVSLVAGGNAVRRLWPNLAAWLGERST